MYCG